MIIRKQDGTGLVIVGQTDHSRFVGQLAAHWGNREFAPPDPFESVVRAASYHDFGWLRYETAPLLDAESGEPYPFLRVPLTATQLASYQWSLDWMADIDPYAGLIVSMHRTGLWKGRYGTIAHPKGYNLTVLDPAVQAFVERNEARQEQQRASLGDKSVWGNYRLMQVWDLLGLYFCCQDPYPDFIDPVPAIDSGDGAGVRLTFAPEGPRRVRFEPYPFATRPCRVQLLARRLPAPTYPDLEAFRRAYYRADAELLEFELA
jgi:hypothetical protein